MIQVLIMTERDAGSTGQVTASAADIYESFFVPALFGQWPEQVLKAAGLSHGDDVLDVGCGTGIVARAAARRLNGSGSSTGIDINNGMLDVARQTPEPVEWRHGPAERLPFTDHSFDRVISQFALMFFVDQAEAVAEMTRVTRPGGTVTLATWADIERSPGYAAMVELLGRLFGDTTASALLAPFSIGTEGQLRNIVHDSLPNVTVATLPGVACFESLDAWIHTDVRGWTLADLINDDQYAELQQAAAIELARFVQPDGRVHFEAPALVAVGILE